MFYIYFYELGEHPLKDYLFSYYLKLFEIIFASETNLKITAFLIFSFYFIWFHEKSISYVKLIIKDTKECYWQTKALHLYMSNLQKKLYQEWLILCLTLYPIYLFAWYGFLSHLDYFYKYRIYELFTIESAHQPHHIITRITFRKYFRSADLRWYCTGYDGQILIEEADLIVYFWIFVFIFWNLYYIISTIFWEYEAHVETFRSSLFLLLFVYFCTRVGHDTVIVKHWYRYVQLGYYCKMGYLLIPAWAAISNSVEDYSDDDEEIDFYNFTDEHAVSDDVMEYKFGGSEITGMFWDTAYVVDEVVWKIWKYTDIYHMWLAPREVRRELEEIERIHPRVMGSFHMSRWYKKGEKAKEIIFERKIRNGNINHLARISLHWRLRMLKDTWLSRILLNTFDYLFRIPLRLYQDWTGKKSGYMMAMEKYYVYYWHKFNVPYFIDGRNTLDIANHQVDIYYSREHRDLFPGLHGLNKWYLASRLDNLQNTFEEDDLSRTFNYQRYRDYVIRQVTNMRWHFYYEFINASTYNHRGRLNRKLVYKMILFGIYTNETVFLKKKKNLLRHYYWRVRDFEAFLHPTYVFIMTMIDEKYESLTTDEHYYNKFQYIDCVTNDHLKILTNNLFLKNRFTYHRQVRHDHIKRTGYGDDIEYMIWLKSVSHTSLIGEDKLTIKKRSSFWRFFRIISISQYNKWLLGFNFFSTRRRKYDTFLAWPRHSVGLYHYQGDPTWKRIFFTSNIMNAATQLKFTAFHDYKSEYCKRNDYLYNNMSDFKRARALKRFHNWECSTWIGRFHQNKPWYLNNRARYQWINSWKLAVKEEIQQFYDALILDFAELIEIDGKKKKAYTWKDFFFAFKKNTSKFLWIWLKKSLKVLFLLIKELIKLPINIIWFIIKLPFKIVFFLIKILVLAFVNFLKLLYFGTINLGINSALSWFNYWSELKTFYRSYGASTSVNFLRNYALRISRNEVRPVMHTKFRSRLETIDFILVVYHGIINFITDLYIWKRFNKNQRITRLGNRIQMFVQKWFCRRRNLVHFHSSEGLFRIHRFRRLVRFWTSFFLFNFKEWQLKKKWINNFNIKNLEKRKWISPTRNIWFEENWERPSHPPSVYLLSYHNVGIVYLILKLITRRLIKKPKMFWQKLSPLSRVKFIRWWRLRVPKDSIFVRDKQASYKKREAEIKEYLYLRDLNKEDDIDERGLEVEQIMSDEQLIKLKEYMDRGFILPEDEYKKFTDKYYHQRKIHKPEERRK